MPLKTLTGVVIRCADYKDNDKMLSLFTREEGMVSAIARGCKKMNSELRATAEPFVYGQFGFYLNKDKLSIESCDLLDAFYPIREDHERFTAGMYMLSVIDAGTAGYDPSEKLFELLIYALTYCAYSESIPADLALCFAAKCLEALGYRPAISRCSICGKDLHTDKKLRFSSQSGGAVCADCFSSDAKNVSILALEALRRMLALANCDIVKVKLPESIRNELKGIIGEYAQTVLDRKIKALSLL